MTDFDKIVQYDGIETARSLAAPQPISAVETLVNQIRAYIAEHNLVVGDPLPSERELGTMFSSSRTTVREAMRMLKAYGLVDVRPKVGAVIVDRRMDAAFDLYSFSKLELSRETFLNAQEIRLLIERGSVDRLFEKITPADIANLRAINQEMRDGPLTNAPQHDYKFHLTLVGILNNEQILTVYQIMKPVILRIMENGVNRLQACHSNFDEHVGIVDALESRNRLAFQYRISQHFECGLAMFTQEEQNN